MSLNVTQSNQNLTLHVFQSNVKATLSVTQNINELHITAIQNNEITKLQPIVNTNSSDFIETDPLFQASEASLFVAGDKSNLDNQSGINTGDETTTTIQTKRPLKTVTNKSLEGVGNIGIDYNDLDNKPPIFPPSSIISKFIFNEIPSGIIDGINSIFNTNFLLVPDTEVVFINGQKQKKPDDYNISGQTITFTFSPGVSESVAINYIKQ